MSNPELRGVIQTRLAAFVGGDLLTAGRNLVGALGYRSSNRIDLDSNRPDEFLALFDANQHINSQTALVTDWRSVDILFQLSDTDVRAAATGQFNFDSSAAVDGAAIQSYIFLTIDLAGASYTRTQLAGITREVNKLFPMPVMILFRHGVTVTLAVIDRRMNRKDQAKDVLEKVTLIKEIACLDPHRGHLEILADLSFSELKAKYGFANFVGLHDAWHATLDTSELNKRFFRDIANWYYWATERVSFPDGAGAEVKTRNAVSIIRLITRLIFVWFMKEKGLIPEDLFDEGRLKFFLKWNDPKNSTYYRAILQNLFFATLNTDMDRDKPGSRRFRYETLGTRPNSHYGVPEVFRFKDYFADPDAALALFAEIPFLNGGLFECLDRPSDKLYIDGFSERPANQPTVPDYLFFGPRQDVDLNEIYDTRNRQYEVQGLIRIFDRYKFTIEENTPIEEEVALDPELLGKVFENLLAEYNPETGATARKQTGSFYTPRVVVDYMVDESLLAYLETGLKEGGASEANGLRERLRDLLGYTSAPHALDSAEATRIVSLISNVKVLDPACGSGAFPMGILHKLVRVLGKLDPQNDQWRELQRQKALAETEEAYRIGEREERQERLLDIEESFDCNSSDYGRKLYLIENCIYGVDIQPIAVQIAKLRFFISLLVDQRVDNARPNRGIRPLPNLETKFVAANTLIGVPRPPQMAFRNPAIEERERELASVRRKHFAARSHKKKEQWRAEDKRIRGELAGLLRKDGWDDTTATKLAGWDPYDQRNYSPFFDPEWMFSLREGFDIVIGNPPYVRQEQIVEFKSAFRSQYTCYTSTADLYVYFYERGLGLLRQGGILTYISSNKFFRAGYGANLRAYLGGQTRIEQIIDFGDTPVFTAIAYPSIIVTCRSVPDGNSVRALTWETNQTVEMLREVFSRSNFLIAQRELRADGWRLGLPSQLRLLEKLKKGGKLLGEVVNGKLYRGIITGLNEAWVVNGATRDQLIAEDPSSAALFRPFLRGRDVKRWQVQFANQYLIKIESSDNVVHPWSGYNDRSAEQVFAKIFPAVYKHFMPHRAALQIRDDQGRYFWELRSCAFWPEFSRTKIILPAIAQSTEYAIDTAGLIGNDKTSFCISTEANHLLGCLNSQALWWFIRQTAASRQGGFYEFKPMYVSQLPIPSADHGRKIEATVDRLLARRKQSARADVSDLEQEMNEHVYKLFNLSKDEIRIIEDSGSGPADDGTQT